MLYLFFVDTGHMVTFDMNLALGTVSGLREAVEKKMRIPESKQVLLINGGESLSPESRVCSYSSAGTDTSPIFVFNKSVYELAIPPTPFTDYCPDVDLRDRVESCLDMEASYTTVVARTELAKHIHEISSQQVAACEKLVHDQHLQHQGWRAVVANLEDNVSDLQDSWTSLQNSFEIFLQERGSDIQLLNNLSDDVALLKRIPLLQPLSSSDDGQLETLFDWINKYDHQKDLEQMASLCLQAIDRISEDSMEDLKKKVDDDLNGASREDMKEIRGLEERLSGLELIMANVKKTNSEQQDCSNSLFKNQQRASTTRDSSVFPDLCRNHRSQLQLMLKNYDFLRERRSTVANAKKELSNNLHHRLKWVMSVEKKMLETSERIMMFREVIRRHKLQMDVVRQIHSAPQLYVDSVIEVVRRRSFASIYQEWSSSISIDSSTIYESETITRRSFTPKLISHFLSTMFPGISDRPPAFAINPPPPFDQQLPQLNDKHVLALRDSVPELFGQTVNQLKDETALLFKKYLDPQIPDAPITQSVAIDCSVLSLEDKSSLDQSLLVETMKSNSNYVAKVKDDMCTIRQDLINCRSELSATHSKIEEQIVNELSLIIKQFRQNIAVMEVEKSQKVEELQLEITKLKGENEELISRESNVKQDMENMRQELENEIAQVKEDREKVKVALVERECEFEDEMKKALDTKEQTIQKLSGRVTLLQDTVEELTEKIVVKDNEIEKLNQNIKEFEEEITNLIDNHAKEMENVKLKAEEESKRAVKEMKDRLNADHKNELESLRSRFKLAVSTTAIEKGQDSLSLDQVVDRETWLTEKNALMKQVEDLKKENEEKLKQLTRSHSEELTRLKQVQFNETLNKLMKDKDEEIKRLKNGMDQLARRHSVSDQSPHLPLSTNSCDKVAVLSCEVGDLVLLCFAPKYNSYVVFSLNPVLHFLHSDSVSGLTSNLNVSGGAESKSWYLVIVTEKEYCQAKKPNNRYKVEMGTRFYRVKAIPWKKSDDRSGANRMSASVSNPALREEPAVLTEPIANDMSTSCHPKFS